MRDNAVRRLRNSSKETRATWSGMLCLALLVATTEPAAQPCPWTPNLVEYEGDGNPEDSRPTWLLDGDEDYTVNPPLPPDGMITTTIRSGAYINISEMYGHPSVTWVRLSAKIRIDDYDTGGTEASGAVVGAADPNLQFGFYFIEQDVAGVPVRRIAPTSLDEGGIYTGAADTADFDWLASDPLDFHEYEFYLDVGGGYYFGYVDGEFLFGGSIADLNAREYDPDPEGFMDYIPGGAYFTAGGESEGQATVTIDKITHEVCLTDCEARARCLDACGYEGDAPLNEAAWPPWFTISENADVVMTLGTTPPPESASILIAEVDPITPGDTAQAVALQPVFSEMGRQVEMTVRALQVTTLPAGAEPQGVLGFGFVQSEYQVLVMFADYGGGDHTVAFYAGESGGEPILYGETPIDWTEFHEYRIVEHPEDDNIRLYIDNTYVSSAPRAEFPSFDFQMEGFMMMASSENGPSVSWWDYVRWDFRRDGFEEVCDGEDNDCDGTVDNAGDDLDADGVWFYCDNCPDDYNPGQEDSDGNGIGDVCELDPVANAGQDQNVTIGSEGVVFLDGRGSVVGPRRLLLECLWTQYQGPAVELHGQFTCQPAFRPADTGADTDYGFELSIYDGYGWSEPDSLLVTVQAYNEAETFKTISKVVSGLKGKGIGAVKGTLQGLAAQAKTAKRCLSKSFFLDNFIAEVEENRGIKIPTEVADALFEKAEKVLNANAPCLPGCDNFQSAYVYSERMELTSGTNATTKHTKFSAPESGIFALRVVKGEEPVEQARIKVNGVTVVGPEELAAGPSEMCVPIEVKGTNDNIDVVVKDLVVGRTIEAEIYGMSNIAVETLTPTPRCSRISWYSDQGDSQTWDYFGPPNLEYFDPDKESIIFIHGFPASRETFAPTPTLDEILDTNVFEFKFNSVVEGSGTDCGSQDGVDFNFGVYDWSQFKSVIDPKEIADVTERLKAEQQRTELNIWNNNKLGAGMVWCSTPSLGELALPIRFTTATRDFLNEYYTTQGYSTKPIHIVAHSMGHQLALHFGELYLALEESQKFERPASITLLEPGWAMSPFLKTEWSTRYDDSQNALINITSDPGFQAETAMVLGKSWRYPSGQTKSREAYSDMSERIFDFWVDTYQNGDSWDDANDWGELHPRIVRYWFETQVPLLFEDYYCDEGDALDRFPTTKYPWDLRPQCGESDDTPSWTERVDLAKGESTMYYTAGTPPAILGDEYGTQCYKACDLGADAYPVIESCQ